VAHFGGSVVQISRRVTPVTHPSVCVLIDDIPETRMLVFLQGWPEGAILPDRADSFSIMGALHMRRKDGLCPVYRFVCVCIIMYLSPTVCKYAQGMPSRAQDPRVFNPFSAFTRRCSKLFGCEGELWDHERVPDFSYAGENAYGNVGDLKGMQRRSLNDEPLGTSIEPSKPPSVLALF
jgi:hypothetical protein